MEGMGLSGASIGLNRTCYEVSHAERGSMGFSVGGGYWVSVGTGVGYLVQWGSLGLSRAHWGVICSVGVSGTQ